MQASGMWASLT